MLWGQALLGPTLLGQTPITGAARFGRNLVANPSAELGVATPDAWFLSATGAAWAVGTAHSGVRALRLHVAGGVADWRSAACPVRGGAAYHVAIWVRGAGSPQTFLTIRFFSDAAATAFLAETNLPLAAAYPDWTLRAIAVTAPASAVRADLVLRCPAPTTTDLYADDFSVRQVRS